MRCAMSICHAVQFSRQYPRKRHDAVTRQWDALSAGKEFVFLAELEDFLETKFQDGDHYQMLKALPTPISDIYESEAGIDKEVRLQPHRGHRLWLAILVFDEVQCVCVCVCVCVWRGGGGGVE